MSRREGGETPTDLLIPLICRVLQQEVGQVVSTWVVQRVRMPSWCLGTFLFFLNEPNFQLLPAALNTHSWSPSRILCSSKLILLLSFTAAAPLYYCIIAFEVILCWILVRWEQQHCRADIHGNHVAFAFPHFTHDSICNNAVIPQWAASSCYHQSEWSYNPFHACACVCVCVRESSELT